MRGPGLTRACMARVAPQQLHAPLVRARAAVSATQPLCGGIPCAFRAGHGAVVIHSCMRESVACERGECRVSPEHGTTWGCACHEQAVTLQQRQPQTGVNVPHRHALQLKQPTHSDASAAPPPGDAGHGAGRASGRTPLPTAIPQVTSYPAALRARCRSHTLAKHTTVHNPPTARAHRHTPTAAICAAAVPMHACHVSHTKHPLGGLAPP